jgi:drug/metabolite transporter (DMT)-like permease
MPLGVLFAIIAYTVYSLGDAIVKHFGDTMSVFEIGFFFAVFSLIPAAFAKPAGERWRDSFKLQRPLLVHVRSVAGALAAIFVTYAFTTIQFAEAYSIIFLMPFFITVMSVTVLGEKVGGRRWFFLLLSFAGVMLVVRPGFRALEMGHLAAVACAVFSATVTTVLRVIAPIERRVSLIALPAIYVIVLNAVLMLPTFVMPTLPQFALLVVGGSLAGMGHIMLILATRNAPASQVAPAQYIQIVWAIALGATFFSEFPDAWTYAGLVVVVAAGLSNIILDGSRARMSGRFAQYRGRPGQPAGNITEVQGPEI